MRDWQDISEWSDETSVWNAQFRRSALDLEYYCLVPSFCNYNQQAITKRTTLKIIVIYISSQYFGSNIQTLKKLNKRDNMCG